MDIINKNINEIIPYSDNAKKHTAIQIRKIADSIEAFGWGQPIAVDKNNVIIAGHGRFEAAKLLNLESVPVLKLDIDEEKAKAYRLSDNKLNESEWDMGLVIKELKDLSAPMVDLTGFDKDLLLDNPLDTVDEDTGCQRCKEIEQIIAGHQKRSGHKIKY